MNAKQILSKLITEANNVDLPSETRETCREASNFIEGIIVSPMAPKMRNIPFSGFYEAVCPSCGKPLQTDMDHCEKCGQHIDWKIQ